jgi:putative ABC transport system substrate-binding protein
LSRSFAVASSIAIFFIDVIIAVVSNRAQGLISVPGTAGSEKEPLMHKNIICLALSAVLFALGSPAHAQQPAKVPRIGYLTRGRLLPSPYYEAFKQGLRELGYVEGKNIVIEGRSAEGKSDRVPKLASELVRLKVDVIVAVGPGDTGAAREATPQSPL